MGSETITITCNPDGSYRVASTEMDSEAAAGVDSQADAPLDQTVQTVDEVLQLVKQELGDDQGPTAAWNAEAAQRDPTGQRMAPGQPSMSM